MRSEFRVGMGYDLHRLTVGRRLILGGVEIDFERGLEGHSDADVLTHAIIDAILGALALGDIGRHFPDTDPSQRDRNSLELLVEVYEGMAKPAEWEIVNLDATVVAERPMLAAHIPAIRRRLAETVRVPVDSVSVKAKTNEGVGPVGEGQAIAAQAVVLLGRKNS